MCETGVFKVTMRGRDLSQEDALRRFHEVAGSAGINLAVDDGIVVRTFPPLIFHRSWPDWLPDPIWVVTWKQELE